MTIDILHVHDNFHPFISGPVNRILSVIQHTFFVRNHSVVSLDRSEDKPEHDSHNGIAIRRFEPYDFDEFHRFIHFGSRGVDRISEILDFMRDRKPTSIALYYAGTLPSLILRSIRNTRIVYMPIIFRQDCFDPLMRSPLVQIGVFDKKSTEHYRDAGIDPNRITVLERPVDTDRFVPFGTRRDPFRLLYVGRIHPIKQIPELLYAISALFSGYSQLHLHIVGDLDPPHAARRTAAEIERIKQAARQLNVDERILFRGRQLGQALLLEYSQASIHVLPSKTEMRSTVTQEALAMGLHCVNTNKRPWDWPEFRPDGERLIHYVEKMEDFAPTIREILESGSQPDHREFIEQNWSWRRWRGEYERLFTEW